MPEGRRRASAAAHQATITFASANARLGRYFTSRPAAQQGFHGGSSVTLVMSGREGRHIGCS